MVAAVAGLALALTACDGGDEREANYRLRGKELFEHGELTKAKLEFRNALQINPTSVEAIFYLGRIAEEEGDLQTATSAFRQVVEQDAKHVQAQLKLGQFFLLAEDRAKATEKAQAVLALEPKNPDGHALLAAVYLHQGLAEQAQAEARAALEVDAANIGATSVLAGLRSRQGQTDEALQLLDAGLKLNPKDEGLRLIRIQILTDAKRLAEADAAYRELIAIAPAKHGYKVNLARLLISEQKIDEAEAMLRQAIEAAPDDKNLKMLLVTFLAERQGWHAAERELIALSKHEPDEPSYRFRLADFYAANGSGDEARAILQDLAAREGTTPVGLAARAGLARVALRAGDEAEAEMLVGAILKTDPRNAEALLLRAGMATSRRDSQAAVADLRTILRDQPNSIPALDLLAQTYLGNGERELAVDAYRGLLAVDQANGPARLALAGQLRALGRPDEALAELEAALKVEPDSLPALKAKGLMMIEEGNLALAESIGRAVLERPDGVGTGRLLLGLAAAQRQDHAAAIEGLSAALDANPRPEEALPALVEALLAAGRDEEALARLTKFTAQTPSDAAAFVLLADTQYRLDKVDDAEASLRQAIAAKPAWPAPYLKLGSLYQKRRLRAEALTAYSDGLAQAPASVELLLRSALAREALGRFDEARAAYEAVLARRPGHQVASNNLAILIVDVWPNDTALMDQARRLAEPFRYSSDPPLLDTLGWVQYRLGNNADAVQLLERAAVGAPGNQQIRYHLGAAYQAQGEAARAKLELEKAISGAPDYRGLDEARKILSAIGTTASTPSVEHGAKPDGSV